jgi:hypothetical protein
VQIDETLPRRLREFFRRHAQPNSAETLNALFYLRGPHGSGARRLAEAACTEHGAALLVARADTLPDAPDAFDAAVLRLVRDATLADAALCLEHCEALLDTQAGRLQRVLEHTRGRLTFFTGSTDWNVRCDLGGRLFSEIVLACPPRAVREASWRATLGTLPSLPSRSRSRQTKRRVAPAGSRRAPKFSTGNCSRKFVAHTRRRGSVRSRSM